MLHEIETPHVLTTRASTAREYALRGITSKSRHTRYLHAPRLNAHHPASQFIHYRPPCSSPPSWYPSFPCTLCCHIVVHVLFHPMLTLQAMVAAPVSHRSNRPLGPQQPRRAPDTAAAAGAGRNHSTTASWNPGYGSERINTGAQLLLLSRIPACIAAHIV